MVKKFMDIEYDFGINGSLRRKENVDESEFYLFNAFGCMKAYSFNGERFGYYGYDASGERTYKMDITFLGIWTNEQEEISDNWEVSTLMLYPNGYLNINQNGEYTKHYYADALRIASKIGTGFSGNICDSAGVIENAYPGYLSDRILKQNEVMQNELYEVALKNPSATLNFVNPYSDFCSIGSGGQETGLFFYHADHLGSTGMVTDINSQVTQGYLYAPFGEILQEYASIDNRIPKYAFNAKELDEENGMYYYSARYYAPPTFISRDPLFEKYPSISPYTYCGNNPVKLIDPNGEWPWEPTNVKDARKYARQTGESFEKYKVGGQTYDSVRVENTSTTPAENTPGSLSGVTVALKIFKPTNDSWGDKIGKLFNNIKGIFGVSENGQGQETKKGPGQKEDMGEFTESWPTPLIYGNNEQILSSPENKEQSKNYEGTRGKIKVWFNEPENGQVGAGYNYIGRKDSIEITIRENNNPNHNIYEVEVIME